MVQGVPTKDDEMIVIIMIIISCPYLWPNNDQLPTSWQLFSNISTHIFDCVMHFRQHSTFQNLTKILPMHGHFHVPSKGSHPPTNWMFVYTLNFCVSIFCCQMASRVCPHPPPPLYTMCKKTSDLVGDDFPRYTSLQCSLKLPASVEQLKIILIKVSILIMAIQITVIKIIIIMIMIYPGTLQQT